MNKTHSLSSPMVVHSFDVKNNQFRLYERGEELLGLEIPYLSIICTRMYLANCTRPNISFSMKLLAKYSFPPT